jgi:two-component system phosphate regulon sensor histidine kinase PhoR
VPSALHEAVRMMEPLAQARGVELGEEIREPLPPAWISERALVQVLVNLVANAVKFTPPQGRVTVRAGVVRDRVRIDVEDTGVGIPAQDQLALFERDPGSDSVESTHGLGLAISHSLVEAMHGTIEVHSEPGTGSTFTIWLRTEAPEVEAPSGGTATG